VDGDGYGRGVEWDAVERHTAKLKTAILKALKKEFPTA
jgi:hypothetical protein